MELLRLLEHLRNPIFDKMNMVFTVMGESVFFLCILCLVFWCINKHFAYRICFIYILSGITVQTLKISFKIQRPFIRDTSLTPVKSARATATGYSFPSVHTQSSTTLFSTFSLNCKKGLYKILCYIPILLVIFSRMYLGVHTPYDVASSFIITIIISLILNYIFNNFSFDQSHIIWMYMFMSVFIIAATCYTVVISTSISNANVSNMYDVFKCCGAATGFITGWYFETNLINFDEHGATKMLQAVKYIIGIISLLLIKIAIEKAFSFINLEKTIYYFIEYMILCLFITIIYPIIIKKFLTNKNSYGLRK